MDSHAIHGVRHLRQRWVGTTSRGAQQVEKTPDLSVPLLYPFCRARRSIVGEGRRIERLHVQHVGGEQSMHDGKLVVDFVARVGVDDDSLPLRSDRRSPQPEHRTACAATLTRQVHFMILLPIVGEVNYG